MYKIHTCDIDIMKLSRTVEVHTTVSARASIAKKEEKIKLEQLKKYAYVD